MNDSHDWQISLGVGVRDTKWLWVCKTHTWECPLGMPLFFTVKHEGIQERLF